MNKLMKSLAVFVAVCSIASQTAFAATATKTVNMSAAVASGLTLRVDLFKTSVDAANAVAGNTAMNFGTLAELSPTTGTLRSNNTGSNVPYFTALISAASNAGTQYTITQNGSAMTSSGNSLPAGALVVKTGYVATPDNGGAALVGTLNAPAGTTGTSWVGNKTLYTSDSVGSLRAFQAYYSVTDEAAAGATTGVPLSQPAGTYTGTILYTVTV